MSQAAEAIDLVYYLPAESVPDQTIRIGSMKVIGTAVTLGAGVIGLVSGEVYDLVTQRDDREHNRDLSVRAASLEGDVEIADQIIESERVAFAEGFYERNPEIEPPDLTTIVQGRINLEAQVELATSSVVEIPDHADNGLLGGLSIGLLLAIALSSRRTQLGR